MSPTPINQAAHSQDRTPATTQVEDDRASLAPARATVADLKGDIIAWLDRLEARRVEEDQASDMSAGSSTLCTYAEARTGLGRNMTLASLEDKVVPGPKRQHAAGLRH
ncbi:hypothetical protein KXD40_000485 [Peronospora effusa]|nr:hypothetical protein KXD40_000485 [Peronospora effusa]